MQTLSIILARRPWGFYPDAGLETMNAVRCHRQSTRQIALGPPGSVLPTGCRKLSNPLVATDQTALGLPRLVVRRIQGALAFDKSP